MTDNAQDDPFLIQEQEFKDKVTAMHKAVPGLVAAAEADVVGAAKDVEVAVVDEVAALKAEFSELEERFKAAASRLEDLVVRGVGNPVFSEAKKLVSHVAAIARSL